MHIHHMQTESMTVDAGRVGVQIAGEPEFFRGPGETVTFAPGVEHRFWNAGEDELVMTGEVYPPHNLEYFLTQVFASTKAHGGRPGAFDGAFLHDPLPRRVHADRDPRSGAPLRAPDPGLPRPPVRPLRPLRGRPGSGSPPFERYTPRPHDQRP